jgi:hypothetical protein
MEPRRTKGETMRLTRYLLPIILLLPLYAAEGRQSDAYVSAVIERSESQFALGQVYLKGGKKNEAKEAFDKAVDMVLESDVSIRESPKLRSYYLALVEKVYEIESSGELGEVPGFAEQKFEPSPLDTLRTLELDKKPEARPKPCNVAGTARIELRGFRLGMTAAAVRSRLPALVIPPPDRYGYSLASVSFLKRPSAVLELKDVLRVTMSFLDGRLATATMVYADSINWESDAQFRQQVATSMSLDGAWQWVEGDSDARQMRCQNVTIIAGRFSVGRQRLPFVSVLDGQADYLRRARVVEEAVRKAKAAEDRRKAFKP